MRLSRFFRRIVLAFLALTILPVASCRWLPPPTSAFMMEAWIDAKISGNQAFDLRYRWVPWEEIAPAARLAVVAAEDQRFAKHLGFDLNAIGKAWAHNQKGKRIRGASTISQQLAKNLFLYSGRNYFRKVMEVYLTAILELTSPKQRILELYLNVAQFGDGIYGVGEASRIFFGKTATRLSSEDAALLAAVLPNPVRYRVDHPSAYVQQRKRWILKQMRQLGGPAYLGNL